MASPEGWIRNAIEDGAGCPAYPVAAPGNAAPPYVLYSRNGTDRERNLDGSVGSPVGDFAIEIYSDGYLQGKGLADLVRAALNDFSGEADGATIDHVDLTEESDGSPIYLDGRDVPTYVISQSFTIRWQE